MNSVIPACSAARSTALASSGRAGRRGCQRSGAARRRSSSRSSAGPGPGSRPTEPPARVAQRDAVDQRLTGGRPAETGQQVEQGRLAGAVRPQQPEDGAGGHFQVERAQSLHAAVGLGQPAADDRRRRGRRARRRLDRGRDRDASRRPKSRYAIGPSISPSTMTRPRPACCRPPPGAPAAADRGGPGSSGPAGRPPAAGSTRSAVRCSSRCDPPLAPASEVGDGAARVEGPAGRPALGRRSGCQGVRARPLAALGQDREHVVLDAAADRRGAHPPRLPRPRPLPLNRPTIATDLFLMEVGDFLMMRKMLLGIRSRSEATRRERRDGRPYPEPPHGWSAGCTRRPGRSPGSCTPSSTRQAIAPRVAT